MLPVETITGDECMDGKNIGLQEHGAGAALGVPRRLGGFDRGIPAEAKGLPFRTTNRRTSSSDGSATKTIRAANSSPSFNTPKCSSP